MSERKQIITPEWQKPVIAVPLTQAFPALGEVKEFKSKICLFNHNRTRVFDVVSDKYKVIDHGQALTVITDSVQGFFSDTDIQPSVRSMQGGARIVATFKLPLPQIKVKKGDLTDVTLTMRNSYDRSSPFSATLGGLRLVCTNGMKMGTTFGSIKARHVGGANEEARDEYIHGQLSKMAKSLPLVQEMWQEWDETKVSYDEAVALLHGKFPQKYLGAVLSPDRFPRSKWELYNDLTRFATHDTKSIQRRLDFDDTISRLFYEHDDDGE